MLGTDQRELKAARELQQCAGCSNWLPLRPATAGETPFRAECCGCGVQVLGTVVTANVEAMRHIRLIGSHIDESLLPKPDNGVEQPAKRQERRSSERRPWAIPVTALALDRDLHPMGEPFRIMTRDVSQTGIGLRYFEEIEAPCLALQLPDSGDQIVQVVVELVNCRPVEEVCDMGGRFLSPSDD